MTIDLRISIDISSNTALNFTLFFDSILGLLGGFGMIIMTQINTATNSAYTTYKSLHEIKTIKLTIMGPVALPICAKTVRFAIFFGIFSLSRVRSVINATMHGLIKPNPIPQKREEIENINNEVENTAIIMLKQRENNPLRTTGNRPLTSESAPENNWIMAFGIVKIGIKDNKSLGLTLNSAERVPNMIITTFPVKGPIVFIM